MLQLSLTLAAGSFSCTYGTLFVIHSSETSRMSGHNRWLKGLRSNLHSEYLCLQLSDQSFNAIWWLSFLSVLCQNHLYKILPEEIARNKRLGIKVQSSTFFFPLPTSPPFCLFVFFSSLCEDLLFYHTLFFGLNSYMGEIGLISCRSCLNMIICLQHSIILLYA